MCRCGFKSRTAIIIIAFSFALSIFSWAPVSYGESESQKNQLKQPPAGISNQCGPSFKTSQASLRGKRGGDEFAVNVRFFYEDEKGKVIPLTDNTELKSGQHIGVGFKPEIDCFVHILWRDSEGNVGLLFPNPKLTEGKGEVKGGTTYWLPVKQRDRMWYVLNKVPGSETVYFVASRERNPKLEQLLAELAKVNEKSGSSNVRTAELQKQLEKEFETMGFSDYVEPSVEKNPTFDSQEDLFQNLESKLKISGAGAVYKLQFKHLSEQAKYGASPETAQVQAQPKPEEKPEQKPTDLVVAAEAGDLNKVKQLLDQGIPVNTADKDGDTALIYAADKGNKELTELLLSGGAKLDQVNNNGDTALIIAADRGHKDVAELLVGKGAKLDQANKAGDTALFVACFKGHLKIAELLVAKGADVTVRHSSGITPLHSVACGGAVEVAAFLIKSGLDVNAKAPNGGTPLMDAVLNGHLEMVKYLLANKADPDLRLENGDTALLFAANKGNKEIAELLLSRGVKVDQANNAGETALFVACFNGHPKLAELLLAKGADLNARNSGGVTVLHSAACGGHVEAAAFLIKSGLDVNTKAPNGSTPLMEAAFNGHSEMVKYLLGKGANPNLRLENGNTALALAKQAKHDQVAALLTPVTQAQSQPPQPAPAKVSVEREAAVLADAQKMDGEAKTKSDWKKVANRYLEALSLMSQSNSWDKVPATAIRAGEINERLDSPVVALMLYLRASYPKPQLPEQAQRLEKRVNEAQTQSKEGHSKEALELYQQALMDAESMNNPRVTAALLESAGIGLYSLQPDKALECFDKAVKIHESRGDSVTAAVYLDWSAKTLNHMGKSEDALKRFEKLIALYKKTGNRGDEGLALNQMARVYFSLRDFDKARKCRELAVAACKEADQEQDVCEILIDMGSEQAAAQKYEEAVKTLESALELARKHGDKPKLEAKALQELAMCYDSLGNYGRAWGLREKQLAILKNADSADYADGLVNSGKGLEALGQWDKALEHYNEALTIARNKSRVIELSCLRHIGDVYALKGENEKALKAYQDAIDISKSIGMDTWPIEWSLGDLYLSMGQMDKARELAEKTGNGLAFIRAVMAQGHYKAVVSTHEKMGADLQVNDVGQIFAFNALFGLAYENLQKYDKAAELFQAAVKISEETREGIPEGMRISFYQARVWGVPRLTPYEGLTRVMLKMNKPEDALKNAELTKARTFAEALSRRAAGKSSDVPQQVLDSDRQINAELASTLKGLDEAYKKGENQTVKVLTVKVKELREKRDAHITGLRKSHPMFSATKYPQPMGLDQAKLANDERVLAYQVTESGVAIFLVHGSKIEKALFKPIPVKDLDALVRAFRDPMEITPGKDSIVKKLESFDFASGKKLADLLLADSLPLLPKGAVVTIVADGSLGVVPFEMLVLNSGGKVSVSAKDMKTSVQEAQFFGDRNPLTYSQSITALTLARTLGNHDKPGNRLLVVADPVFRMQDDRAQGIGKKQPSADAAGYGDQLMVAMEEAGGGSLSFNRLKQTGILAEQLNKTFAGRSDVFTGLEANKTNFIDQLGPKLGKYSGIVFATHGYFGARVPGVMEPILALTMVPSGTDGFLRMSEITKLRMNADTVALTACQSGLGLTISGEGTMGMGRAFQYAGAKSVLMTLWSVSEKTATQLAQSYFRHIRDGKPRLEALQAARSEIRSAGWDHPFFWAPFILVGDGK